MGKLKRMIDGFIEGRNGSYPLATMQECIYIYNAIKRREKPAFVQKEIYDILTSCGIPTIQYGIGWKVR